MASAGLARRILASAFALAALATEAAAQDRQPVELELVLAVDSSVSVNPREFHLQMAGLAAAVRDERVVAAIQAVGERGIAVTLVQWAEIGQQAVSVDWMRLHDAATAEDFARAIEDAPREFVGAATAITYALRFAVPLFQVNEFEGKRRVIDISGDGVNNSGPPPTTFRNVAVNAGITVNGLAIVNEYLDLDLYYEESVIGGSGAFVMVAEDYRSFADAIVAKLVREILSTPVAAAPREGQKADFAPNARYAVHP